MIRKCIACEFRSDEPDVHDCPFCFKVLVASPLESFEADEVVELVEPQKPNPTGGPMWLGQSPTWTPPRGPWEVLSDNGLGWILLFVLVVGIGYAAQDWLVSGPPKPPGPIEEKKAETGGAVKKPITATD